MATRPLQADMTSAVTVVQITSAIGGAGQALASTPSQSIEIANNGEGRQPFQYKVGAGAWTTLSPDEGVHIPVDLSSTTVLLRKFSQTEGAVPASLTINNISRLFPVGVPLVVVGATAPSNADGRPDGTIYIQTA